MEDPNYQRQFFCLYLGVPTGVALLTGRDGKIKESRKGIKIDSKTRTVK